MDTLPSLEGDFSITEMHDGVPAAIKMHLYPPQFLVVEGAVDEITRCKMTIQACIQMMQGIEIE